MLSRWIDVSISKCEGRLGMRKGFNNNKLSAKALKLIIAINYNFYKIKG